jgi:hypothetical protein
MKAAQVREILDVWTKEQNVPWEQIAARPGDKQDEVLVGAIELPYTREITLNTRKFYYINFGQKQENDLKEEIASYNAERLSDREISTLINNPPLL